MQNLHRWPGGPLHNSVPPVTIEFKEKKDRQAIHQTSFHDLILNIYVAGMRFIQCVRKD